jgi:hypothetical protein
LKIIFQLRGFKFGLVFIASPKESLSLKTRFDIPWPYKSKFKASELENDFQVDVEGISDEHILHSAVGILRRDMQIILSTTTKLCKNLLNFRHHEHRLTVRVL